MKLNIEEYRTGSYGVIPVLSLFQRIRIAFALGHHKLPPTFIGFKHRTGTYVWTNSFFNRIHNAEFLYARFL